MTSRAPTEPKASHLAHVLFACAKERLANAPKAECVSFADAAPASEAMTLQELYDRIEQFYGKGSAKNVAVLIGPVNEGRGYPLPFKLHMLRFLSGGRQRAVIFKTDGL